MKISPKLVNEASKFLEGFLRGLARSSQQTKQSSAKTVPASSSSAKPSLKGATEAPTGLTRAVELDSSHGLPDFDYEPHMDGDPDPGEIVWTWVPYEEDPDVGKDRPVLVVARIGSDVAAVQMTSQDHDRDAAQESRHGRYWLDIGSGNWDAKGRPSEVRLDRILRVPPSSMRREGGILDQSIFNEVVQAIKRVHAQR